MYKLSKTPQFIRDVKTCQKKHWEMEALKEAVEALALSDEHELGSEFGAHSLQGAFRGKCAIRVQSKRNPPKDKWVIVYEIYNDEVIFVRTGAHDVYR